MSVATAAEPKKDAKYFRIINEHRARRGIGPHPDTPKDDAPAPPLPEPVAAAEKTKREKLDFRSPKTKAAEAEAYAAKLREAEKTAADPAPERPVVDANMTHEQRVEAYRKREEARQLMASSVASLSTAPKPVPAPPPKLKPETEPVRASAPPPGAAAPEKPPEPKPAPEPSIPLREVVEAVKAATERSEAAEPWGRMRETARAVQSLLDALSGFSADAARRALDWVAEELDQRE